MPPRPFRPHIHKNPCRRLGSSGARRPNHQHGHLCTWDPCPTVKEGCPRRATGESGGDTVPLTTEVIGDLRRGRLPRYRCWMCSRSSHIPVGNVAWRRVPTYASKNRTKPHAHVAGQWVPTYASKHHVEPQAARSRSKTVSSPHAQTPCRRLDSSGSR